jgi:hypothetical protein
MDTLSSAVLQCVVSCGEQKGQLRKRALIYQVPVVPVEWPRIQVNLSSKVRTRHYLNGRRRAL